MSERDSKTTEIRDLDKSVDAKKPDEVKGGATPSSTSTAPTLIRSPLTKTIIPCV
jgi:hypothetical protein